MLQVEARYAIFFTYGIVKLNCDEVSRMLVTFVGSDPLMVSAITIPVTGAEYKELSPLYRGA